MYPPVQLLHANTFFKKRKTNKNRASQLPQGKDGGVDPGGEVRMAVWLEEVRWLGQKPCHSQVETFTGQDGWV
jgi:hypothetical protein